ncbi:hypothetical protein NE237_028511 [Protea cynaroides]|uniref:Protein kinase domain-containing protein n=1 Tax=Protea cynaroides TaxID=273540 RepID=A0A9Q0JSX9_9MAGN|nr:hypothetical protein NE237_028511 [Protea cynaroides]
MCNQLYNQKKGIERYRTINPTLSSCLLPSGGWVTLEVTPINQCIPHTFTMTAGQRSYTLMSSQKTYFWMRNSEQLSQISVCRTLMGKDQSRIITTVRGTRGYLAPEWLLQHGVSEKSDIFSYGMLVLEIIGGRRNVNLMKDDEERYWSYFPRIVCKKEKEGKLMEVVDERLLENGGIDEKEVKHLVDVALWCIQEDPKLRPAMARVVEMLDGACGCGPTS